MYILHFHISVAPKVSPEFMGRDIIAKRGEPFKISIPYTGRPVPTVEWSNVSIYCICLCKLQVNLKVRKNHILKSSQIHNQL
jgi:hypothetical protein